MNACLASLGLVALNGNELTPAILHAMGDWWLPLLVLVAVAVLFFVYLLRVDRTLPYERIDSLCTRTELEFYRVLAELVGNDFQIFGKTRIADLLKVKKGTRKRLSWQNRINCKHIDFILCDPKDLRILLAIELDDPSHDRPDRIQRDEFVNQAFTDARLPILRIKTVDAYNRKKIRQTIDLALANQNKTFVFHLN